MINDFFFSFDAVKNLQKEELFRAKRIGRIYFIYLFIYSGLEFTITFLMYHKLGYTSLDQAKMFVTTGVVMALLQGSVVRRLPAQQVKSSAVFGLFLIVPAFILVGLANDGKLLYAGMILFAICKSYCIELIWFVRNNNIKFKLCNCSNGICCHVYDNINL